MNIRTLELSREVVVFLVVTGLLSVVYLAMNVGDHLVNVRAKTTPADQLDPGKTVDVSITLVTADVTGLSCASDETSGTAHCAFTADGTPWERTHPEAAETARPGESPNVIAPYMTADNVLLLVPGLWSEPTLNKRLQEEPPTKYERDQLRRFNANCKLAIERRVPGNAFKVRWAPVSAFGEPAGDARTKGAPVGRVSGCTIVDT